jgi:hypothetical protein
MKRYKTFPHTREALDTLYGDRADLRAAFDAEDQQEEAEMASAREAARAEETAYQTAHAVIQRARLGDGPTDA